MKQERSGALKDRQQAMRYRDRERRRERAREHQKLGDRGAETWPRRDTARNYIKQKESVARGIRMGTRQNSIERRDHQDKTIAGSNKRQLQENKTNTAKSTGFKLAWKRGRKRTENNTSEKYAAKKSSR